MNEHRGSPFEKIALNLLRIVTGFLFMLHGVDKLFGWFGGVGPNDAFLLGGGLELNSLAGVASILETFGGLAVMLGLYTRQVALVLVAEMTYVYLTRHLGRWPMQPGGGENALFFLFAFLYLTARGGGKLSIDGKLRGKS